MKAVAFSPSPDCTGALGRRLGALLRPGDVVSLEGEVGAGKTVLAHGILAGLGIDGYRPSPTFALVHSYPGPVHHIDVYRLGEAADALFLVDEGYLEEGIAIIEWGDRLGDLLPPARLRITLESGDNGRRLTAQGPAERWGPFLLGLSRGSVRRLSRRPSRGRASRQDVTDGC